MSLEEMLNQGPEANPSQTGATEPPTVPTSCARETDTSKLSAAAPLNPPEDATKTDIDTSVFGSFWVEETEFALPVSAIQEVVNEPEVYTQVPLSPQHVRGLFSLRKMIIPVIDLRILLGYPRWTGGDDRKVAIIENGNLCVGLLFDDTGGVINGAGAGRVMFQSNAEAERDVVIEGVLKLDGGARMVQLLDPYKLLDMEKLPRVAKHADDGTESHHGRRLNCITFQLGHTCCAIDLRFVQEITEMPELHKSVVADGHTIGNVELRGVTMPIVDFRGMLGTEPPFQFNQDTLRNRKLVVMKLPAGCVGLVVYSIDNIMAFYEGEILPFANVALPRYDLVAGCLINENEEIVILLDHEKLMADSHLVAAAQSCQEIYPSEVKAADVAKTTQTSVARATYVLFRIDMPLALDIACVSEIINRPEKLLRPPYALKFVDGILNLRGELITLINPRLLYGVPDIKISDPKVLIFHAGEKKYGMIVDSIDEIVTTQTEELVPVPSIAKKGTALIVSEDVLGCLQIASRGVESEPVMVIDVNKLISRCVEAERA